MAIKVKNIARRPVSLHCNSGRTVHLAPDMQLELPEVEIADNAMFEKLMNNKLLEVIAEPQPAGTPAEVQPAGRDSASKTE